MNDDLKIVCGNKMFSQSEILPFPSVASDGFEQKHTLNAQISACVKRFGIKMNKLPRKKKKRLKTQLSNVLGIPVKYIHIY